MIFTRERKIGKGAFGEVFKGIDNRTGRVGTEAKRSDGGNPSSLARLEPAIGESERLLIRRDEESSVSVTASCSLTALHRYRSRSEHEYVGRHGERSLLWELGLAVKLDYRDTVRSGSSVLVMQA